MDASAARPGPRGLPHARREAPRAQQPEPLARLLDDGPFDAALRAAIRARGMSLARLQDRLQRAGVPVSAATLSCWQSGRYQPERAHARAALPVLERILDLPAGALAALVGPPKPRGRWLHDVRDRPSVAESWWDDPGDVAHALAALDTRWSPYLTCLSRHQRVELDGHGRERLMWSQQVLRAECDGPDRFVALYLFDQPAGEPPRLTPRTPCRVGRSVAAADGRFTGVELLFGRALTRGETAVVAYTVAQAHPRHVSDSVVIRQQVPARTYLLEVCFDAGALPAACHAFQSDESGVEISRRSLRLDADRAVHAFGQDLNPGRFGIRWTWPQR